VSNCPKLRELGVVDCELKELDVTNNPNLEKLYCTGNKIKELDLSKNVKMENLYCKQPLFRHINIIRPANNPDLGNGATNTWHDGLTLIWRQNK
jgi:Leucine-rich repeat (LRR) protein